MLLACLPLAAWADKKKTAPEPYGLITVSVFQESGFALPEAQVTLLADPQPDSAPVKVKRLQAVSSPRGECVFRVPPTSMRYKVKASARGFQSQEKSATVSGEERVDVTFQLQPESK